MSVLFNECIEALDETTVVLSLKSSKKIIERFKDNFPVTNWGRVDWQLMTKVSEFNDIEDFNYPLTKCYIIWSDADLPVVKSNIKSIIASIDDVTAVSFDTWIYFLDKKCVLEFFHDGKITFGYATSV